MTHNLSTGLLQACCVFTCCTWSLLDLQEGHSFAVYTRKNAQLVTNLHQTCSKSVATTCWQDVLALVVPSLLTRLLQACSRLATSLMNSTALLQVCSNNLLSGCNQQLVNKLWVTNLVQLDKITALLQTCWQACYKLVASTTCWQVVRFCVCTSWENLIPPTHVKTHNL